MGERTYLDTSDGMADYAERHGAKHDEYGWYIEGDVPAALVGLLPKEPNRPAYVQSPSCPKCGASMILRPGKPRDFWGCSQYRITKCRGTVDYERHLDALEGDGPSKSVANFLVKPDRASDINRPTQHTVSSPLQEEIHRVIALAVEIRGNGVRAEEWLTKPKVGLRGKVSPTGIPLDVMRDSIEGCRQVAALLESTRE